MARIQCDFFSEQLMLSCNLTVILPERPLASLQNEPDYRYPTLYLLHGLSDDHTVWHRRTAVERYADERGLAVVMPAVHRSFYTDMAVGYKYWSYLSQELPARAQAMFPLSRQPSQNFVAGLSMGGYGAFKWALRHPEQFAAAASFSGVMDVADMASLQEPNWQREMAAIFGDPSQLAGSENDLFALAQAAVAHGRLPKLYQWCGTDDFLYPSNVKFHNFAQSLNLPLTYHEGPGDHSWRYWDQQIEQFLAWLPL